MPNSDKMKDKCVIRDDGINIYITLINVSRLIAKIGLIMMCIFLSLPFFIIIIYGGSDTPGGAAFGLIIFLILYIVLPLRLTIWNLFGKEHLIINTKTFSYQHDYGIILTNLKTQKIDLIGLGLNVIGQINDEDYGKLDISNFDKETDIPQLIYESSIYLTKSNFDTIIDNIKKIYENVEVEDFGFTFSNN